ncbi:Crp/Fnr family transcriptional regulator [Carnobacterium gallinarum]|uniref:Crp/Fnr family transcriptional regulator n=1 Tax=Carnobacterium gallinarum TaxID=2749 RepID=UPI000550CCAD|nr:Crp/Fnr family transcriptional regulator [Carnobacterium gallinarum]
MKKTQHLKKDLKATNKEVFTELTENATFVDLKHLKRNDVLICDKQSNYTRLIISGVALRRLYNTKQLTIDLDVIDAYHFVDLENLYNSILFEGELKALTDIYYYDISRKEIEPFLKKYPEFLYQNMQYTTYISFNYRKINLLSVYERIIFILIEISLQYATEKNGEIFLPKFISQKLLASLTNTSISATRKILVELMTQNIIRLTPKPICIYDFTYLLQRSSFHELSK